jgi:hypothetical protein
VIRAPSLAVGPLGDLEPTGDGLRVAAARVGRREVARQPLHRGRVGVHGGAPGSVAGVASAPVGERGREDSRLDRHRPQQRRFDPVAGRLRRQPHLVGEGCLHVVVELVDERVGRRAVEVRLVLDRDDPPNPLRVRPHPTELDPVASPPRLDEVPSRRAVDRLADVPPRVARMRERIAVPRPRRRGVPDDV